MDKGYVHVYTGNGKGKSTAAFGLAVRAACANKRVYIGQFVKDMKYSETALSDLMPLIEIEQLGLGCFITKSPEQKDIDAAAQALQTCAEKLKSGIYDLVILDEINIALYYGLISDEAVIEALNGRSQHVEVVLTGRYAPDSILEMADLVTEMKEIKHYYKQGVLSRKGIDC